MLFQTRIILPFLALLLQLSYHTLAQTTLVPEFTGFPLVDTSPLTVTDTTEQRSAFLCVDWCYAKYATACKVVLFDSQTQACQRVHGGINMGMMQRPSAKSLFFGMVRGT